MAEIVTNNIELTKQLNSLQVPKANGASKLVRLTRKEIQELLASKFPNLNGAITWGGADTTLFVEKKQIVDMSEVAKYAEAWVLKQVDASGEKVKCKLLNPTEVIEVPLGAVDQSPVFEEARWLGNTVSIPYRVLVNGVLITRKTLHFKVSIANERASHDRYEGGSALSLNNQRSTKENTFIDKDEVNNTSPNQEMLIQKGQRVSLVLQTGSISVEVVGVAQSTGALGQRVIVKRLDSLEALSGKVSGVGQVLIKD